MLPSPEVSEAQSAYLLQPVTCDRQKDLQLHQSDLRHGNDGVGQDAERRRGIYTPWPTAVLGPFSFSLPKTIEHVFFFFIATSSWDIS